MRKSACVIAAAVLGCSSSLFAQNAPYTPSAAPAAAVANEDLVNKTFNLDVRPRQVGLLTKLIDPTDSIYKQTGIEIYGHAEAGYTYNFDTPSSNQNAFRSFDFQDQKVILDQLDISIERKVDYRKNKFDIGGNIEFMWGADAGLIHANGIFDWYDGPRNPENQFDPVQFYADLTLPVFNGMRVRIGKFVNLVGFESINPTSDFIGFYSRSFVFGSGYPFTHFGGLVTFDLDPGRKLTFTGGITRGDEQGFKDGNDSVSFLGSLNWVINDKMALYLSNSTGPEQPGNNSDYRTTWDLTFFWQPTEKCKFLANGYFLYDNAGASDGGSGYLYSVAALGSYDINKMFTVKLRGEYFHDEDGVRTLPNLNLYELTVGMDIRPLADNQYFSSVIIRPEVRFDYSDDRVFDGENHQITFGIDAIIRF